MPTSSPAPFPIVGVGASAGGLEAFTALLQQLPASPGMAIVLVQHLDPYHESQLTSILSSTVRMPVVEVSDGMPVRIDHVYVIPPNVYMAISQGAFVLTPRGVHSGINMPIDYFLRSLAGEMSRQALGVILSGGGADGTAGLEAIKAVGGITFAQTEVTAAHSSMPRNAIASGAVDIVLAPGAIARELVRCVGHPYVTATTETGEDSHKPKQLAEILETLRARSGVDFKCYKANTIQRRIHRRMAFRRIDDIGEYLSVVKDDLVEADALFQDLLLRVTRFFRDRDMFAMLDRTVFPALLEERPADHPVRIWVPGCSTGEEVYSIAITLMEHLGAMAGNTPIKILATDVNELVLERARRGTYPESIAQDVSQERLRRFFRKVDGQYRISQSIRDACVFAKHDVCAQPPFAHMELISCRNLLIYLDPELQRKVLDRFHYALKPYGFLVLGTAETPGEGDGTFTAVDRDHRIYRRGATLDRTSEVSDASLDPSRRTNWSPPTFAASAPRVVGLSDVKREADRMHLRFAPAGVLIDDQLRVLEVRGDTTRFLRAHDPEARPVLAELLRDGLPDAVIRAVAAARENGAPVRVEGARLGASETARSVRLNVVPVRPDTGSHSYFLVLFEDSDTLNAGGPAPLVAEVPDDRLRLELDAARAHLQGVIETYEATNEELTSANEEIHASNEELQSTNEELQTTKEELQSVNEELETTNEEQKARNRELGEVNDDLTNLLAGTHIPVLMVSRELKIRRFTSQAQKVLGLGPADAGRPLGDVPPVLDLANLSETVSRVIDTLTATQLETQDRGGHWYSVRIRPYETGTNKIDGAVISLIDIEASKRSELELRGSRDFVSNVLNAVRECLVVLDVDFRVKMANRAFYRTFDLMPDETVGKPLFELGHRLLDIVELRDVLEGVRAGNPPVQGLELEHLVPARGQRTLRLDVRPVLVEGIAGSSILLGIEDVTEIRAAELSIQQARRMESLGLLAGGVAHDLNNLLTPVIGYATLALDLQPAGSEARRMLEDVVEASEQAAALVQQILTYAGKGRFVMQAQDLSRMVEGMSGILRPFVPKSASIHFELDHTMPPVKADSSQLRQVVMNLVVNAAESLESGTGTLTVRTGVVELPPGVHQSPSSPEVMPPGSYAFVEVADTGCGMNRETIAKVFDPFFTTKFTGRGLGLAAVIGIVQAHKGGVTVQSAPGQGSVFRVLLPSGARTHAVSGRISVPSQDTWRGHGTILLVDDEEKIRSLAGHFLERCGFDVLMAGDGDQALRVFDEHRAKIVAVLMDVAMPNKGGIDAAKELRARRRELPIVLMSGYSVEDVMTQIKALALDDFVHKPFTEAVLVRSLRRVLGGASPPKGV